MSVTCVFLFLFVNLFCFADGVFGILFGRWLKRDQEQAYSGAIKIGFGFLVAFMVVRYLDGFGNILPRMGNSWIDFLNLVKYNIFVVT